jgi:hypothetical protein
MNDIHESEIDLRIWKENATGALRLLKEEQAKNHNLIKLIWAIVRKHGGEIRLDDSERGLPRDDWQLLEYPDPMTQELVIKAQIVPQKQPCAS